MGNFHLHRDHSGLFWVLLFLSVQACVVPCAGRGFGRTEGGASVINPISNANAEEGSAVSNYPIPNTVR